MKRRSTQDINALGAQHIKGALSVSRLLFDWVYANQYFIRLICNHFKAYTLRQIYFRLLPNGKEYYRTNRVLLLVLNKTGFRLGHNQQVNCQYAQIAFNLKVIPYLFLLSVCFD